LSEQTSRARQALLHKRLRDKDRLISDRDVELVQLRAQLDAKERVVHELSENVGELQQKLAKSESVPQAAELHTANQSQVSISVTTFCFCITGLLFRLTPTELT